MWIRSICTDKNRALDEEDGHLILALVHKYFTHKELHVRCLIVRCFSHGVPAIIGASPSGKATDSDSVIRWFESISPCQYIPKTAFSGTRSSDMSTKTPFWVHVPAMRDIRKEKGQ